MRPVLDPGRAEQVRIFLFVRSIGEAAIQPELEFPLAATHAAPAIEQNAGDYDDANDNQPLAQTDIHVVLCPLMKSANDGEERTSRPLKRGAQLHVLNGVFHVQQIWA
ncbi:hypothetical protein D3C85_1332700 [compost metagenome]